MARSGRWNTYIILGEEVEGAEHLVVLEIEGAGSLEIALEGGDGDGLYDELLGGARLTELLVVVRGRDPGRPP